MVERLHDGEVAVSAGLARRLIAAQMPEFAGLPLRRVGAGGTDHLLFRVGTSALARFARIASAAGQAQRAALWLPDLARSLPLRVPCLHRLGAPSPDYPFVWSVTEWIGGQDGWASPAKDGGAALAGLVAALRRHPVPADAPPRGDGGQLAVRDGFLRRMIGLIGDEADPAVLQDLWQRCLALPPWQGPAVWLHGDLHPLNLIVRRGRLVAVIDWGGMGTGDPAEDLLPAWAVLGASDRAGFRAALAVSDAEWARGWAFAFSKAVMAVPYYRHSNPRLYAMMRRLLDACLADCVVRRGPV